MTDVVERLDASVDKSVAFDISMMTDEIRKRYALALHPTAADEITRLTAALEDARGNAMPKATVMRSEDLNAVVVHIDGCGPRLAIMCKDEAYRSRLEAMAYEIMRVI